MRCDPRTEIGLLEHDPEKWIPVFGKRSCSTKRAERDDDSKRRHPALGTGKELQVAICQVNGRIGGGRGAILV